MRGKFFVSLVAVLMFISLGVCQAKGPGSGFGGPGSSSGKSGGMKSYDASSVKTISGIVVDQKIDMNPHMNAKGLHFIVETDDGTYKVHAVPEWVMERYDIRFENGERLEITGAEFVLDDEKNMYAATIKRKLSDLPKDKQKALATEALGADDLPALAKKYGVDVEEVKIVKERVTSKWGDVLNATLFEKITVREKDSGDRLWSKRPDAPSLKSSY